ncbi:MAG: hypothetical protein O3A14_09220 [Cyanobacteria bacterium]|nr:hypothetical protein [Cyanobacteriota bacterium]
MIRRLWRGGQLLALVLALMLGLTACGGGPAPPADVVTQAVTQQAETTQRQLWQGLSRQADAPKLQINRVKPTRTRSIWVDGQGAYQIKGNYQLDLRYSSRRVKQKVPFEVILQPVPNSDNWQWLYPVSDSPGTPPQWQTQLLPSDPPS